MVSCNSISLILLVISFAIIVRSTVTKSTFLLYYMLFCGWIVLSVIYLVSDYFSDDGIDEAAIFHMLYGFKGAGFLEYLIIIIPVSIVAILMISGVVYITLRKGKGKGKGKGTYNKILPISSLLILALSIYIHPAVIDIYQLFTDKPNDNLSQKFYEYYHQPSISRNESSEKKNLVFIYAESFEGTYFNKQVFPDLVTQLNKFDAYSTIFLNIEQVVGTSWTIAGITASQCGIPLFTSSGANSMSGMDEFLPNVSCLGDQLSDSGYKLSYMGGADLEFAGKGKFFRTHGFTDINGKHDLKKHIEDPAYLTSWGLFDDSLLNLTYNKFIELSKTNDDFALFTLTLDTHHPRGHPSKSCDDIKYMDGSNPILNSVKCSDYLISNFVSKILESPYANKTIIVLISDHLAMKNTAYDKLRSTNRKNLFMIIDPTKDQNTVITKLGSLLDVGTTLLPFIGFKGDVGLGRNLITASDDNEQVAIHKNLHHWRDEIIKFWNFPQINKDIYIDVDNAKISIDNREFPIPILIEIDKNLQSTLKFEYKRNSKAKTLIDYATEIDDDKNFILVEFCSKVEKITNSRLTNEWCLVAGRGQNITRYIKLDTNFNFTKEDIYSILNKRNNHFIANRVAHAGGGIGNIKYTNSIEALNENYDKGFRYFELDFSFTSDNNLVCIHDWGKNFTKLFGYSIENPLSLQSFNEIVERKQSKYKNCTIASLDQWMKSHPDSSIITDIKEDNLKAIKKLLNILPDSKHRIIPQIYNPEDFFYVKNLGYEQIIWTLYLYSGGNENILDWTNKFYGNFAITMPKYRAITPLPKLLNHKGIPSYVHTINDEEKKELFINANGITEIYTDYLYP